MLLLVSLEQLTYAEAARVLDIPQGTVMSRLARARELMRRLLDGGSPAQPVPAASSLQRVK
ncbi:RNA polymerase sigma factor [compost metagenome]